MRNYLFTTPLNMPRGSHYGSSYRIFYSRKLSRRVKAYSNLEHDNLITLEMNPAVKYYCEQPCEATVETDGKYEQTYFDVYVVYTDGREELQEVKYYSDLQPESKDYLSNQHQITLQTAYCKQKNLKYVVRTDNEIYTGNMLLKNLEWLAAKVRRTVINENSYNREAEKTLLQFIKIRKKITILELLEAGRITSENGMDLLAELYYKGNICFLDIEKKQISNNTEIEIIWQ